ncbi:hypothetical protein JSE7799_01441 [Jannaschia seosinensis]|uniref:PemK-like protein n=1 Tax=Jannaschia seosinensis TaxID=313367 RepID=A0A0M7BA84_9RHOB|nr:hypothetical protein [Jannaschia seosinensis]CUH38624.1 hypothetical protein JSE7799_01441 [Jannaschia seosinensis]
MLDSTPTIPTMTHVWRDHVGYGDIVSFRFPLAEEESQRRPKARPCLILDIEVRDGQRYALLAYGTTSRRRSNVGYEVQVRRRADHLSAGLDESTRFVGAQRLLVPLTHSGFVICGATGSAVLGRLDGAPFEAMNAVRGRIHAERDIAAERRSNRRRKHGVVRERNLAVERRTPRRAFPLRKAVQR